MNEVVEQLLNFPEVRNEEGIAQVVREVQPMDTPWLG